MTEPKLTFQQKLSEFVRLSHHKRELAKSLTETEALLDSLEGDLLEQFSEIGMQNTRVDGLTVYMHAQIWAGAMKRAIVQPDGTEAIVSDRAATCDALINAGQSQFVEPSFNTNTLSAWVRELPRDDNDDPILPDELQGRMTVTKVWKLRTRK